MAVTWASPSGVGASTSLKDEPALFAVEALERLRIRQAFEGVREFGGARVGDSCWRHCIEGVLGLRSSVGDPKRKACHLEPDVGDSYAEAEGAPYRTRNDTVAG